MTKDEMDRLVEWAAQQHMSPEFLAAIVGKILRGETVKS
jgi:hypothetical protein